MHRRFVRPAHLALVALVTLLATACGDASETVTDVVDQAEDTVQLVEFCTAGLEVADAVNNQEPAAALNAAETMAAEAPEEIAPQAQTVLEGIQAAQEGDTQALQSEEFQQAANELATYTRENCNPTN